MNPALIEPDCELPQSQQSKKPRLTPGESAAMVALLSFRTATPLPPQANVEQNLHKPITSLPDVPKTSHQPSHNSNITDDEESICSRQSQDSLRTQLHHQHCRNTTLWHGSPSPPPLCRALVKPSLPTFSKKSSMAFSKLPQGRPIRAAPGLAKHLVKQTKPILLKLS